MVTVMRWITIRSCLIQNSWLVTLHRLNIPKLPYPPKRAAVHMVMSASWIGVTPSWCPSAKRVLQTRPSCFVKVLFAVWAQRVWMVVIQEAATLNQSQPIRVVLQCKAPPTGNKAWILVWAYRAEPVAAISASPSAEWQSAGDFPLAGSVSGLVEQDVSWLRVLGNVWRQTVELLDRLRVNFLQEKKINGRTLDIKWPPTKQKLGAG